MIRRICFCAGLLIVFSHAALALQPAPKPKTPAKPEEIKKAVDRLIQEGEGALAAADFKAAKDSFTDALQLDKKSMLAAHGLGLTYIALHEPIKACDTLEGAANMGTPDRALLINLAVAQSSCGRAMRGAKFIQKYLDTLPPTQAPDEPLLNTMKIMLESIPLNMRSAEFMRMQSTYDKLNKRLEEKAGNGQKRWGLKWVSAEEYTEFEKQRKAAEQEMNAKQQSLETTERELMAADQSLQLEKTRRQEGSLVLYRAQYRFDEAKRRYDDALAAYQKVADGVPHPEYPMMLSTVPMGDAAGSTNDPTKIAAATTGTSDTQPRTGNLFPTDNDPPKPRPGPGTSAQIKPSPRTPTVQFGGTRQNVASKVTRHSAGFLVAPDLLVTAAGSVKDAGSIEVVGRDGQSCKAEVVRSEGPLALLKVDFKGATRPALALADKAPSGAVQCAAFPSASIFDEESAEVIDGVTISPGGEARMKKHPRLAGSPLLVQGKVVGVELAERESPMNAIPLAALDKVKAIVASDASGAPPHDPLDAVYQVNSQTK